MKKCSTCKLLKNYDQFYKNKSSKDGFGNTCKSCGREYARLEKCKNKRKDRDLKNREKLNTYHNSLAKNNRNKFNEYQRNYYHKYWKQNRKKINEYNRKPERLAANSYKSARRRARIAISSFDGFKNQIVEIYNNCPSNYHVDHIIPLNGENVCGLHVPWNLQYLPGVDNLKKSNKF